MTLSVLFDIPYGVSLTPLKVISSLLLSLKLQELRAMHSSDSRSAHKCV